MMCVGMGRTNDHVRGLGASVFLEPGATTIVRIRGLPWRGQTQGSVRGRATEEDISWHRTSPLCVFIPNVFPDPWDIRSDFRRRTRRDIA